MNKEYKIKLDLNKKLYNKKMAFNQFDENVNDFYIEVTKNNELVKDLDKSIVTLVAIKPNNTVDAQFIEVKEGQIYADLKPSMCDLVGNYQAKAMIVLEGEIVTTDTINYSVNEDKIISRLNDDIVSDERFTLFTDALARLSTIETSEEQRVINEAERILAEENRKIEEAKRVEAELIRVHEEADRTKYDAIRESNENIRKQNESIRLSNETNRIDEEAKRVDAEAKREEAEQLRKDSYNFMTEDEDRRRSEANAHKEAEVLRVQAETDRVNEEAKRRTTEQARVSAENTRVSNENTREASEIARKNNETQRVEAETQRQSRYNSFIVDAEANANNFENYTNTAKLKEEERKSNELDRKSQEDRRISNEVERISNENTRKANEVIREENETSRQNTFANKVSEVDEKISELNTTKDNFVSSVNTKVDNKISEIEVAKSDMINDVSSTKANMVTEVTNAKDEMTTTVSNKIDEVENRFNALTSKQQQDAEVIDARDGEVSLKARLDRDIEKAKQVYVNVEGSNISTDSSSGYLKDVEILGNTVQDASNLADIRSVGDKVEGQELYEIPVVSVGKNLNKQTFRGNLRSDTGEYIVNENGGIVSDFVRVSIGTTIIASVEKTNHAFHLVMYDLNKNKIKSKDSHNGAYTSDFNGFIRVWRYAIGDNKIQLEEGTVATPYEPYIEDKLTILSPVQLEKVGDVADRIIEKDGVWGVEKNVTEKLDLANATWMRHVETDDNLVCKTSTYNSIVFKEYSDCIVSNFIRNTPQAWNGQKIGISTFNDGMIYLCISKSLVPTIDDLPTYLKSVGAYAICRSSSPQFISLPHSQQIKLRTFANKTNISFLTEIEGTIKAQVPKSLGATVNTHTEQINSLNKELDRVKKLEESTVSTVTTESDFTTVEATSGGYFEDVKLEGKTLVNVCPKPIAYSGYVEVLDDDYVKLDATIGSGYRNYNIYKNVNTSIKPSTDYTLIIDIKENTLNSRFEFNYSGLNGNNYGTCIDRNVYIDEKTTGIVVIQCKSKEDVTNQTSIVFPRLVGLNTEGHITFRTILLEGDHTQNPPAYFEGLKSVGQSASEDGADEIVVESVNENLFDIDCILNEDIFDKSLNSVGYWSMPIKLKPNINYTFVRDNTLGYQTGASLKIDNMFGNYSTDNWFVANHYDGANKTNITLNSNQYGYIYLYVPNSTSNILTLYNILKAGNFRIVEGTTPKPYTPHQSDKKRLLYYNNETQAWEKPVLRQWDSIEKHSDGKYYYHKRSGEVVLNGSEDGIWCTDGYNPIHDITTHYRVPILNSKKGGNLLCTHFKKASIWGNDVEGVELLELNNIDIRINRTKLSTQDVQGFKQWLQANNVTVVYQLAQEKVYECTNIDLITYANETNYVVESGVLTPRTTLKVHNNISNVVSLLQKKVSLLESNITSYMITQNRLMLASRYNADTVSFKVDVASLRNSFEYDNDLYELILNNILVGKDNYNREYIENLIIFYWMDFVISDEMYSTLFEIIEEQHNPKIEEETPLI